MQVSQLHGLERRIKTNLEKFETIINMKQPKKLNEVQKLAKRNAMPKKFIFKPMGKFLPFFQLKLHEWNEEYNEAFTQFKEFLSNPPLLSQSALEETLPNFSITLEAILTALV